MDKDGINMVKEMMVLLWKLTLKIGNKIYGKHLKKPRIFKLNNLERFQFKILNMNSILKITFKVKMLKSLKSKN